MKRPLAIILFLFLTASLSAQVQFRKPLRSQKQGANLAFSNYTIGLKMGCPWSVMLDSELSKVTYSGNIGYNFGIVAERYFSMFSVGVEALFSQKGTKMYYDMPFQQSLDSTGIFHREFSTGYNMVSVRVPLTYYFKGIFKNDQIIPYVFIAPQVDIPLSFNATLSKGEFLFKNPPTQTTITNYDIYINNQLESMDDTVTKPVNTNALLNIGALAGVGLMARIPTDGSAIIIKFDVAANFGLRNLAEEGFIIKKDHTTDEWVMKENDHIIRSHDIEANLSIIIPIKRRLHDACYNFRTKK